MTASEAARVCQAMGAMQSADETDAEGLTQLMCATTETDGVEGKMLCCLVAARADSKFFPSFLTFLTFSSLFRTLVTLPRAPLRPPRRYNIRRYVTPPPPPMRSEEV